MVDFYVKLLHLTYASVGVCRFLSLESLYWNCIRNLRSAFVSLFSHAIMAKIVAKIQLQIIHFLELDDADFLLL